MVDFTSNTARGRRMSVHAEQPEISSFVASMTDRIGRHGAAYADEVRALLATARRGRGPDAETGLLDEFNLHIEGILAKYDPPSSRRRGDSLVFRHLYGLLAGPRPPSHRPGHTTEATAHAAADDGTPTRALLALMAADVEFRGPLRLSRTQRTLLADVYEELGPLLRRAGLPAHAALAWSRAMNLHRDNEDDDAEDRCGLAKARAETAALWPARKRVGRWISAATCGYGYRPFRLLLWMVAQLALFSVAITLVTSISVGDAIHLCLTNYLDPAGLDDVPGGDDAATKPLLVTEAYAGIVSTSVFFALLVRRWFRI